MKAIDRDYTFWLAGYYDDFFNARAIPDDSNASSATADYTHVSTHHGSAMATLDRLNSRFAYTYVERAQDAGYLGGDTVTAQRPFLFISSVLAQTHNSGIHEWLTLDTNRGESSKWDGRAQLQYPCSLFANRQKFNRSTSLESWLAFCNGNDTAGTYYCPAGDTDSTDGRSWTIDGAAINPGATTLYLPYAGVTQQSNFLQDVTRHLVSFAGTYMAERNSRFVADVNYATHQHFPIESPSGQPFFISQLYGPANATERIIAYDGNLNAKGITDTFTIRMAWSKLSDATLADYILKIGFDNSDGALTFNKSTQQFSRTTPAITLNFNPSDFSAASSWLEWTAGSRTTIANDDIWYDIDVVLDFASQEYTAYYNEVAFASTVSFASKPTGGNWAASDFYGWSLDAEFTVGSDGFLDLATLIDRVGLVVPLSDAPHTGGAINPNARPPILDFSYTSTSNGISSMSINIADDDDDLLLTPLVTGNTLTEWWLLAFRDNINRPFWRGPIEKINYKQSASKQTAETQIVARDALALLQRQLPIWEKGQGGSLSMSSHTSIGVAVTNRIDEIDGMNRILNFGKVPLRLTESTLGYDYDKYGSYSEVTNQRMSLNSGHPIQMYINEDDNGPNDSEDEWLGKGSTYGLQDIEGIRAFNVGGTDYMMIFHKHKNFAATNSVVVKGTTEDGTYTIATVDNTLSNNDAIDDLRLSIITAGAGTLSSAYGSVIALNFTQFEDVDAVGQNAGKAVVKATLSSGTHSFIVGNKLINTGPSGTAVYSSGRGGEEVWKLCEYKTVTAVPTSSTIMFEVDNWPYSVATVSVSGGQIGDGAWIGAQTHWGSASNTLEPVTPARVYIDGLEANATFSALVNRDSHARWMRDLSMSPFFRAKFGIISSNPYFACGINTNLWKPVSSAVATARSWAANASWNGPAAFAKTATSFTVDNPGLYYTWPRDGSVAILDIIDNTTGEHDVLYATACSTPSFRASTYDSGNNRFTSTGSHSLAIYDIVVHEGFDNVRLNGIFQVCAIPSATAYDAIRLGEEPFVGADKEIKLNSRILAPYAPTPSSSIDPDGIYPLYVTTASTNSNETMMDMVLGSSDQYRRGRQPTGYKIPTNGDAGRMYYGGVTISGVKGQTRAWPLGSRLYHRNIDESNGYKHCWLLWADMRNNGNADADGGYRNKDFGLLFPTNSNYEISLLLSDQYDVSGQLDRYTSLKIGSDCDIWHFDSEVEPYTGAAWSTQTNASDDENYPTALNSWNTKAGAFVLIDTSPFWNLNTAANNGRPGYSSGGRVDLGDYETEHRGFPYLLDAYWREAASSYKNTDTTVADHANSLNWVNDGTILASDVALGASRIFVHDNSTFAASGYGAILLERGEGRNAQKQLVYFHWGDKGTDATLGDFLGTASLHADSTYIVDYENAGGPSAVRSLLDADGALALWITGSQLTINRRDPISKLPEEGWDSVTVYNTPAARFSLRLMMAMDGFIESPNTGTYFEHDKIRTLLNCCMQKSWMRNGTLSCISDIQNVPISEYMTTTGVAYAKDFFGSGKGDMDSYGSPSDANTTILNAIQAAQGASGVGRDYASTKDFTYLIGPDNRLDYRPTYPLYGKTFDRNTMKVADLSSNMSNQINTVRIYYNNSLSFVDYPTPTTDTAIRFKVLQYPNVKNTAEALNIAKEEYSKVSKAQTSIKVELIRDSTQIDTFGSNSLMHKTARHSYIADTCVHSLHEDSGTAGYGIQGASWWSARFGGCIYPGMVNATEIVMDGGLGSPTLRPVLQSDTSTTAIGGVFPSSISNIVAGSQDGRLVYVHSGTTLGWFPDVSINANNQAKDVSAGGWFSFTVSQAPSGGGVAVDKTLTVFIVAADLPGAGTTTMNIWYAPMYRNNDWYYWWGSNSVAHALQIVDTQDSIPTVSETSGERLRVAVTIETDNAGGTGHATPSTADDAVFRVWFNDYSFTTATPSLPSGGTASPQYTPTLEGHTSILVRGSGLYEVALPSSYSSTSRKIIFSFNAEYCKSIMRNRMPVFANAENIVGISGGAGHYTTTDSASIFPLGQRSHTSLHGGIAYRRAWYGPRVIISEDDISFRCSTSMTFTDSHLDFSNEPMVIRGISWSQKGRAHESVTLELERVASQYRYSLANFLRGGSQPGTPSGPFPYPPLPPAGGPVGPSNPLGPIGQLPSSQVVGSAPQFTIPSGSPIGGGDTGSYSNSIGINDLSKTNMSIMRGRMDAPSDSLGSDVTWGLLGQKKVGPAMTSNRSIDGMDSVPTPSKGLTVFTSEGFVLPGIANPVDGVFGETHTVTYDTRIPNDISDSLFSITALISYDTVGSGGVAKITTTAKCLETDSSVNQTITIAQGEDRAKLTLLQPTTLDGLGTAGNTLRVTIERTPGQSGDAGPYQAVRVHSLSVKPRRYTQPSKGSSNTFKPY